MLFISSLTCSQGTGLLTVRCTLQNARNFKLNLMCVLCPSLKTTNPQMEQDRLVLMDLSRVLPPSSGARKDSLNISWILCFPMIRYIDTHTVLYEFFMPVLAVLSSCRFKIFQMAPSVPMSSHERLGYATSDQVHRRNHWKSKCHDWVCKGRVCCKSDIYFFLQNVDLSIPRTFLVKFQSHLMPGL